MRFDWQAMFIGGTVSIIAAAIAVVIVVAIVVGNNSSVARHLANVEAGLQQCQMNGTTYKAWQRDCVAYK